MQLPILSAILIFSLATARPHYGRDSIPQWAPPGPGDFRGPCPMMNTLANEQFLPHDGRNLTREVVMGALEAAINFNASLTAIMFDQAIVANPEPNATSFTLDDLNRHNVLEHDASLSRSDAYFGNNHIFNQAIFDETKAYWTGEILDANMLANGKIARQINSKAFNPTYTFTSKTEQFSLGEVAAPIIVFGDMQSGTVNRTFVEYFFENERLPSELGWTKKTKAVVLEDVVGVQQMIANGTSLITPSASAQTRKLRLRDLHFGLSFET